MLEFVETVINCPGCGLARSGNRMFCECGRKIGPTGRYGLRVSTDDDRGRALGEMYRGVEAGRTEFQRDLEQRFERDVEDHYGQMF